MTSTNPVNWNLLGEFYFTLDATKGEQTIITNETSAYIYNQTSFITVKADSTGGSPSAFIDLGASYWVNTGGKSASAQLPGFDIQADTTIGTTAENYSEEYMVTFERRSRLNVSNNATLTIEGGTKYAYAPGDTETKTSPTINVAEGSTLYLKGAKNLVGADVSFTVNGTLKLGDNASFETTSTALKTTINNLSTGSNVALVIGNETQINSGVVLGSLTLKNTANLSVGDITLNGAYSDSANSKLNYTGKLTYNNDARFDIASAFETSGDFEQVSTNDSGVRVKKSLTLNNGADWIADGKVDVFENAVLTINEGAKLIVNTPASVKGNGRLIFYKNSKLYLNGENALAMGDGSAMKIASMNSAEYADIYINANQKINSIYANNSVFNIYMADGVLLELAADVTKWVISAEGDGEVRIYNFKEETIKVGGKESEVIVGIESFVKLYDDAGTLLGNATLSNGWITLVAVPEPAEWAMILGALALGLAVYRRRK